MHPTLFSIGTIEIYTFGFSLFVAFLCGGLIFYALANKGTLTTRFISNNILVFFALSLLGGRLLHVMLKFRNYLENPFSIFFLWDGGLSMWGVIISMFVTLYYLCIKHEQHLSKWLDILAIAFSLNASIIFLGQFFGGQGFGRTTEFFLGVYYENISSPYSGVHVHPTSLYMSISSFLIFITTILIYLFKRPYYNFVYNLTFILFCSAHIITENLRWDVSYFIFGYNAEKIISIIILIIFSINLSISIINFYASDFKKKMVLLFNSHFRNRN